MTFLRHSMTAMALAFCFGGAYGVLGAEAPLHRLLADSMEQCSSRACVDALAVQFDDPQICMSEHAERDDCLAAMALSRRDASMCQGLSNAVACEQTLAIALADPKLCLNQSDPTKCLQRIPAASLPWHRCEGLPNELEVACQTHVGTAWTDGQCASLPEAARADCARAHVAQGGLTVSVCSMLEDEVARSSCAQALLQQHISADEAQAACELVGEKDVAACATTAAASLGQTSVCQDLEGRKRLKCHVAAAKRSPSICRGLNPSSARDRCHLEVAAYTGRPGHCKSIGDAGLKARCKTAAR